MAGNPQGTKFIVRLTQEEHARLRQWVEEGQRARTFLKHASVLLKADADGPNWKDPDIAEVDGVRLSTVHRVRQAFVEAGLDEALFRKKSTGRP